jgi:hypothetical protein
MAPALSALFALLVGVATPPPGAGESCVGRGQGLYRALEMAQFEKEPEGTVRRVHEEATRASVACPDDETLAYVRLRSAELGRGALVGQSGPAAATEVLQLAQDAAVRFSQSARILTVEARLSRRIDVARRAYAADSRYVPARVALADALFNAGDLRAAEQALGDKRALGATSDGLVVLARIKLAQGDARAALRAANLALHRRQVDLLEPDARNPQPAAEATDLAARARHLLASPTRTTR